MFDKNYYEQKKNNLIAKREQLILTHSDEAFNYVNSVMEINRELLEIENWEKEQQLLFNKQKEVERKSKKEEKKDGEKKGQAK